MGPHASDSFTPKPVGFGWSGALDRPPPPWPQLLCPYRDGDLLCSNLDELPHQIQDSGLA